MASTYFFRTSKVKGRSNEIAGDSYAASPETTDGPSRPSWSLSGICLVAVGGSFAYLRKDALDGYHEILPAYAFAGAAVAGTIVWSYLVAKLSR